MRIISGRLKGRVINMPKGIRPTQDKVRKALFDILADIEGLSFLELFAGSGAVGLEAASAGASYVVFVEKNPACIRALKRNFTYLPTGSYCLLPFDAFEAVKRLAQECQKFNIIFLDPPYYPGCSYSEKSFSGIPKRHRSSRSIRDKDMAPRLHSGSMVSRSDSLAKKTLKTLSTYDIVGPTGFIVIQHFKKDSLPDNIGKLARFRQAIYADTRLSFYKKVNSKSR